MYINNSYCIKIQEKRKSITVKQITLRPMKETN
jgi:hypothetical protein